MKKCKFCKKDFKPKDKTRKFCDKHCYWRSMRTRSTECLLCEIWVPRGRKFCDSCYRAVNVAHLTNNSKKAAQTRWKDHEYNYKANGYVMTKVPEHPYCNKRGYVYVHRIVMEKKLGRYLTPEEVVHHKDGDKMNNKVSNLVLFRTTAEHTSYHLKRGEVGHHVNRKG